MKHFVRMFLFQVVALWFTTQLVPTLVIPGTGKTLLVAGLVLSLLMLIVRPLLSILFIPINLMTLGLFSWFVNVIVVYLLTVFVPEVTVRPWQFPGFSWSGFSTPPFFVSYGAALIITSLILTGLTNLLTYVSDT